MIVALVDDNENERNTTLPMMIKAFQNAHVPVARFDFYNSGEAFFKKWHPGAYDLIILDIIMGEMTGIEVAHKIREESPDVRIVFCSSSNEYAFESYTLNASYYIQKPATEECILEMIERLNVADFELRRFIVLPNGKKLILRNMIFSEYSNHQIEIHLKNGDNLKVWMSQAEFAKLLENSDVPYMITCNKGTIVNLYEVQSWNGTEFCMSDDTILAVSRRKKSDVDAAYQTFLFSSLEKGELL